VGAGYWGYRRWPQINMALGGIGLTQASAPAVSRPAVAVPAVASTVPVEAVAPAAPPVPGVSVAATPAALPAPAQVKKRRRRRRKPRRRKARRARRPVVKPVAAEPAPVAAPSASGPSGEPPAPAPSQAPPTAPAGASDITPGGYVALELKSGREVKGILEEQTTAYYKLQIPGLGSFEYPAENVSKVKPAE
jgi:hypothetical protein